MKRKGLRILLLEDNSSDAVLLKRELSNFWTDAVIEVIYEEQKLISKLKNHKWDIVISDFKMPQMTGLDALKIVRETDNKLPFLMISGTMGEEIAVKVIKAGADDYFLKENLHRLNPAIERALLEREQARHYQEMQNKLADSYFLSDAVIKNSPLGIAVRGRKMRLLHYNAAWQNIWGLTDDEITLQRLSSSDRIEDFYDYAGDYTSRIREVYEKGRELVIPELKLPKNNRLRADWISQHFYALKSENGDVIKVVSIIQDISEQKANARMLQQNEENFKTFFNNIHDCSLILDEKGIILEANNTILKKLGYLRNELLGKHVTIIHYSIDDKDHRIMLDKIAKGECDSCPLPLQTKNGDVIIVESHLSRGLWSGKPALFFTSKDISELKLSEQKFAAAFNTSPVIMGMSDLDDGEYLEVNQTFYDILGYDKQEVLGKKPADVLRLDPDFRNSLKQKLINQGFVRNEEGVVFSKSGEEKVLLLSADILELNTKKINFTTAIDITDRKQAEAKLREAHDKLHEMHQKLEEKVQAAVNELRKRDILVIRQARQTGQSAILSQIAHHWRQPLNTIGMVIQGLADAYDFEELTKDIFAEKINECMLILTSLSHSIENFRIIYGSNDEIKKFEVTKYLRNIADLLAARFLQEGIKFEINLAGEGIIEGVPSDYAQALINILDNSCDVLVSRQIANPVIAFSSQREGNNIVVSISDNGGGIRPDLRGKIFELYSTSKESLNNTGIGLYMTKKVIADMKGRITVTDTEHGVEFKVYVPLYHKGKYVD